MRRSHRGWIFVGLLFMVFAIGISFMLIDFRLKASILQLAKSEVQVSEMEMINKIVNQEVVSQVKYSDIVNVHKDDHGKIVMIQPNTIIINNLMANTIIAISKSLKNNQSDTINVPMGELTGSKLLAGYGPQIKVKIIPSGEVNVELQNKFEQAGINQTRHLLYFQIDLIMKIAVPYLDDDVKVSTTVPLAETVIVGDVPSNYVNFKGSDSDLYRFTKP